MEIIKEKYKLYQGDCLEVMDKLIEEGIKVDAIITDPPYGTTKCKWDTIIPLDSMWERLNKLIKDNGAIVLFGIQPFTSRLICSNIDNYKYDWVWDKKKSSNFRGVKFQPLIPYELISVFNTSTYNPQMTEGKMRKKGGYYSKHEQASSSGTEAKFNNLYYPKAILEFSKADNKESGLHPTQKPVPLMEYLIKTYTNEGDLVLDFTMGSGSTGVACINTDRKFIGIELDEKYFNIAEDRIKNTRRQKKLF